MAAVFDLYVEKPQLLSTKLTAKKDKIQQLRQQLSEWNDEFCKLQEGRKAENGNAACSKGRSTEDRPDRNGDELGKLREGRKADDGIAKRKQGWSPEDTKKRKGDDDELAHGQVTSTKFKRLTRFHRLQITRDSDVVADLLRFKGKIRYRDARGVWHSRAAKSLKDDRASENFVS
jgi:hypothetical protein